MYDANANTAWFDGAQLFRESFEYIYSYDSAGNRTAVRDLLGNVTTYTYNANNDITGITLPGGATYSYTYDSGTHLLTRTVSATGVQTDNSYDAWGNSTGATISSSGDESRTIRSDITWTADGNMKASVTAGDRNTVTYTNDTERSLVSSITDALSNTTSYTYDSMRRRLSSVSGDSQITNAYTDDMLSSITHTNTEDRATAYHFQYGTAWLPTAVKVGNTWTLVSNTYNTGTWTLSRQLYGNGDWWQNTYDNADILTARYTNTTDSAGLGYEYIHNSKGLLVRVLKKSVTISNGAVSGEGTLLSSENYVYDAYDRLVRIVVLDSSGNLLYDVQWTLDHNENVTAVTTRVSDNGSIRTQTSSYTYNDDQQPTAASYGSISASTAYDGYGRVIGTTVQNGTSAVLTTGCSYRNIGTDYTSTQISRLTSTHSGVTDTLDYTYDASGNIVSVSDGTYTTSYTYDSLNQLLWEYNQAAGKAWQYTYDDGGNILTKTEYTHSETLGNWDTGSPAADTPTATPSGAIC